MAAFLTRALTWFCALVMWLSLGLGVWVVSLLLISLFLSPSAHVPWWANIPMLAFYSATAWHLPPAFVRFLRA